MEKISVRVCVGTTCYLLGGSELTNFDRLLPAVWRDRIDVAGTVCLDRCRNASGLKPPFVTVGETLVDQATVEKVTAVLRGLLT